jgi:hypothetical protein
MQASELNLALTITMVVLSIPSALLLVRIYDHFKKIPEEKKA